MVRQATKMSASFWKDLQAEIRQLSPHPGLVEVLGACKGQPRERVVAAVAAGLKILGCNYAQEGEALREGLSEFAGEWHFIGHIQSRKAKELVVYDCVESLDRLSVAEELNRRLEGRTKKLSVLIEVNLAGEETKSGIRAEELPAFLAAMEKLPNLTVNGLMGMPPALHPVEGRRPYFKQLRQLFEKHGKGKWQRLSMGTSEDYSVALQEGATLIRLGTILFGERPPKS